MKNEYKNLKCTCVHVFAYHLVFCMLIIRMSCKRLTSESCTVQEHIQSSPFKFVPKGLQVLFIGLVLYLRLKAVARHGSTSPRFYSLIVIYNYYALSFLGETYHIKKKITLNSDFSDFFWNISKKYLKGHVE